MSIDLGNVPSWVAVVAGVGALTFTGRTYWLNRQREVEEQASKVASWVYREPGGIPASWVLVTQNASEIPVYDVHVAIVVDDDDIDPTIDFRLLEPTSEPRRDPIVSPNLTADQRGRGKDFLTAILDVADERTPLTVTMSFRDARGRLWRRDADGRLHDEGKG